MSNTMPPLPSDDPFATPCFYYGAISVVWCWYEVELDLLDDYLDGLGMKAGVFDGKGLVNFSFMNATSLFGSGSLSDPCNDAPYNPGGSVFNETELNIVAYAKARENDVPDDLSAIDYIFGADQSKNLGVYRLHVACDNQHAIDAGKKYYYENKFLTFYKYTAPNLNRKVQKQIETDNQWKIHCFSDDAPDAPRIYKAKIDVRHQHFHEANASEIIDISYDTKRGRVLGSRRNFFGMHSVALLTGKHKAKVKVTIGPGGEGITPDGQQMLDDMKRLIEGRDAIAVQKFESPTCLAEAIPYYMDQI